MTTPHPILAARPARTVPGVEGSVRREPSHIAGGAVRRSGKPLTTPDRPWSSIDDVRRQDRIFDQGWHDAGGGK